MCDTTGYNRMQYMKNKIKILTLIMLVSVYNCCLGTSNAANVKTKADTHKSLIQYHEDSNKKPFYVISQDLVPDVSWRKRLGRALVTIYIGKGYWNEGVGTFKEAGSFGIKVLIAAATGEMDNDDGTAAFVLRQIGVKGCEAMIQSLKTAMARNKQPDVFFIQELGNSGYKNATDVLSQVLNYFGSWPEDKVQAAVALAKLGDYSGSGVLNKMYHTETDAELKKLTNDGIKTIEELRSKDKRIGATSRAAMKQ